MDTASILGKVERELHLHNTVACNRVRACGNISVWTESRYFLVCPSGFSPGHGRLDSEVINVAVVDDHALIREGVIAALSSDNGIRVVGSGCCADDAVEIARTSSPDVMLLDIYMPGCGLQALSKISAFANAMTFVMLTASDAESDLRDALVAGASGYVVKGAPASRLRECIHCVSRGETYVSPEFATKIIMNDDAPDSPQNVHDAIPVEPSSFTNREIEILDLLSIGQTNKEIASNLTIKETTIKRYISRLLGKLNVRNRVEAAVLWKEITEPRRSRTRHDRLECRHAAE